jgi:hypothetical protein
MTGQEIINKFEFYIDDSSELSTVEELSLLNKMYYKVLNNRPWEFLKKEWSTTSTGANYIALPTDFAYFIDNGNYTDNSVATDSNAAPKFVYVGPNKYRIINWGDRKQYEGSSGYAYISLINNLLYFTDTPASGLAIKGDYIYNPADIAVGTSPIFPTRFHDIIVHYMVADGFIIQLFPKAKSYLKENLELGDALLTDMAWYNSQLINY